MDIYDFINMQRHQWDYWVYNMLNELGKSNLATNMQKTEIVIHPEFPVNPLPAMNRKTKMVGPAIAVTGGAAYIAYDLYNCSMRSGALCAPILTAVPPTYDWDVSVNLKKRLTEIEEMFLEHFFQVKIGQFGLNGLSLEKKQAPDGSYLNYAIVLLYNAVPFNIVEFSFKTELMKTREVNLFPVNGIFYRVPDLLSLMRLTYTAINNRAPIKIKINSKPVLNRFFYKCVQDYQRIKYMMDLVPTMLMWLRPLKHEFDQFVSDLNKILDKYPYCKTEELFLNGNRKIDGKKMNAFKHKLWEDLKESPSLALLHGDQLSQLLKSQQAKQQLGSPVKQAKQQLGSPVKQAKQQLGSPVKLQAKQQLGSPVKLQAKQQLGSPVKLQAKQQLGSQTKQQPEQDTFYDCETDDDDYVDALQQIPQRRNQPQLRKKFKTLKL
jgi:hypothetical protein